MEHSLAPDSLNYEAYSRRDVVKYFGDFDSLFDAERVLLDRLTPMIGSSTVLDIGVGGGRTTRHLIPISREYTAIDYVPQFVKETSEKYPGAKILSGDARDLKSFPNDSFDFVLFSFNGIDCVSNSDRRLILSEILRVLQPGGTFMFSSHNRSYKNFNKLPWKRKTEYSLRFLRFCLFGIRYFPTHLKMRRHEVFNDEYALVNDIDHRFSVLFYYITIDKQLDQLRAAGFSDVEAYDHRGRLVEADTESHWIYYLARKL